MVFKVLDSFITLSRCGNRQILSESGLPWVLLSKRRLCSKKDDDDNDKESVSDEEEVKKLLFRSSPLKSSKFDDFWSTSPYPVGTVFRGSEQQEDEVVTKTTGSRSVVMFPGQGNQFVGMAKNLTKYPVALDMFKVAKDILGYDLLKVCLEGPEKLLNDTKYCQPATFVCSLALLEKIKDEKPWIINNCLATCGYSLGELTALVFAGCMNFEQGLNLVKVRAEAMEKCCKQTPGGMLTIFVGPRCTLPEAIAEAKNHCISKGIMYPVCSVASYLFPNCKVIAGNMEALNYIMQNSKKHSIRRFSMLPVSGAFHTTLMKDAVEAFRNKLKKINLNTPLIKVFSNVTSEPYSGLGEILKVLPKQIYKPVKWQQTMQNVFHKRNTDVYLYECGPGNSLTTVATKNNKRAEGSCFSVQL